VPASPWYPFPRLPKSTVLEKICSDGQIGEVSLPLPDTIEVAQTGPPGMDIPRQRLLSRAFSDLYWRPIDLAMSLRSKLRGTLAREQGPKEVYERLQIMSAPARTATHAPAAINDSMLDMDFKATCFRRYTDVVVEYTGLGS